MTFNPDRGLLGWSKRHLIAMVLVLVLGVILVNLTGMFQHQIERELSDYEINTQYRKLAQQRTLLEKIEAPAADTTSSGKATEAKTASIDPFSYSDNQANIAEQKEAMPTMTGPTTEENKAPELSREQSEMLEEAKEKGVRANMTDDELMALIPTKETVMEPVMSNLSRWFYFVFFPIVLLAVMTNLFLGGGETFINQVLRVMRFYKNQRTYLYVHTISANGN